MSDRFDPTLGHTLKTKPDAAEPDDAVTPVRRIELITGTGRRRRWSDDDKARIIVESLRPGTNVSEVARRNGLSPQQLFGWRREAHALMPERAKPAAARVKSGGAGPSKGESSSAGRAPAFAPVVIATRAAAPPTPPSRPSPPSLPASGCIEIAIGDAVDAPSALTTTSLPSRWRRWRPPTPRCKPKPRRPTLR
jgi:transposase